MDVFPHVLILMRQAPRIQDREPFLKVDQRMISKSACLPLIDIGLQERVYRLNPLPDRSGEMCGVGLQSVIYLKESRPQLLKLLLVKVETSIYSIDFSFQRLVVLNIVDILLKQTQSLLPAKLVKVLKTKLNVAPISEVLNDS